MSQGVNRVILLGRLGQEPDNHNLKDGTPVVNLSIATSESWKDKKSGEKVERTEWHRVVFFNRLAEIASEHLKKGSQVYIEGKLRTRKWEDKSSVTRYTTEIIGSFLQMLGSSGAGTEKPAQGFDDDIPF